MKEAICLSTRQPWAWLITNGYKDVENRTWRTGFRGEFLVHASKTFDRDGYDLVTATYPQIPLPSQFTLGGIVGQAELVDCVIEWESPWFTGPWGFVLANAHPLKFKPVRGKLGFFTIRL